MDSIKKLCNEVETENSFCYLEDRLNASGGCEAAVTTRVRIGWERFFIKTFITNCKSNLKNWISSGN